MDNPQLIYKLVEALKQWVCPACGGKGVYTRKWVGEDHVFNIEPTRCRKCNGTGRHPTAHAAIQLAEGNSHG